MESLQIKYKDLKKMARKELLEAKRDLVKTGNKPLKTRTVESVRKTNVLLQLRSQMGVSATGFQSKHCELSFFYKQFLVLFVILFQARYRVHFHFD